MTMIDGPDISEVTRHLHFAWSLPARGIAMATGDSSLRRVSTVTDLLSFISVAGATQPGSLMESRHCRSNGDGKWVS